VRGRVIARYVGEFGLALGLTTLVPTVGAVVFGELEFVLPYGLLAALLYGVGILARRIPVPRLLQPNEAYVITVAAFFLTALVMTFPLTLEGLPLIDAVFEAISGVTTTGLSTLESLEARSRTFLLARAWLQWIGGLGIVVLSLALALESGLSTRLLGMSRLEPADVVGSMRLHARRVLLVYLTLTAFGIVLLLALGATGFDAVVHTFAGISTGGFAPRDDSLAPLARSLQVGILGLSLLGAFALPLYLQLSRGHWRRLREDREAQALLVCIALCALLLAGTRWAGTSPEPGLPEVGLLAVSAQTTTGFSTLDVETLSDSGKLVVILSMITGGSHGSTAGGMKLIRLLILMRLIQWLIAKTQLPPHAVSSPGLAGGALQDRDLLRAAAVVVLFLGSICVSWLIFLLYGYPPLDALFEVSSATGTVGLSVGIARPELEPFLKGVLCTNMFLGRLEVFAVLVALSPRTWIGRRGV
jgi:trk system potassium uptake protein TrkH